MNSEKRFIPGTNPKWDRELPDEYTNSLVDAAGNNYDNGYNFDEKDDHEDEELMREKAEREAKTKKDLSNAAFKAEEFTIRNYGIGASNSLIAKK